MDVPGPLLEHDYIHNYFKNNEVTKLFSEYLFHEQNSDKKLVDRKLPPT